MSGYMVIESWTCDDEHGHHELTIVHRAGAFVDTYDMAYWYRPVTGSPHWPHHTHRHRAVGLDRARELAQETLAKMPIAWVHTPAAG